MSLSCGIVGLPNVGKSTLFNALTRGGAKVENYPFCTIEPNSGIVEVPDQRLEKIREFIPTEKMVPAIVEFNDIAGLVRGASKGEGLGNQFLGHIRAVNLIVHVVRCFEDGDIIHVDGSVDAMRDIETIETELVLADLEVVERRRESLKKLIRTNDKDAKAEDEALAKIEAVLAEGKVARTLLDSGDVEPEQLANAAIITNKPVLYCCNVTEDDLSGGNPQVEKVKAHASNTNSHSIQLCAAIESEIAELDSNEERLEFLQTLGLEESGLETLAKKSYELLGYQTYFTAGEKEIKAWTIQKGWKAPQAAGVIHTDFEKGFIRAETYHFDDLVEFESEKKIRESGKLRVEGKDYEVQDGDIMHFLFNV